MSDSNDEEESLEQENDPSLPRWLERTCMKSASKLRELGYFKKTTADQKEAWRIIYEVFTDS